MSACFHTAGVQCDNCRTGLNSGPWWGVIPYNPEPSVVTLKNGYASVETPEAALARLEATVEDLRIELRALSKLLADHIAAGEDTL
jgi:hypothetical protein